MCVHFSHSNTHPFHPLPLSLATPATSFLSLNEFTSSLIYIAPFVLFWLRRESCANTNAAYASNCDSKKIAWMFLNQKLVKTKTKRRQQNENNPRILNPSWSAYIHLNCHPYGSHTFFLHFWIYFFEFQFFFAPRFCAAPEQNEELKFLSRDMLLLLLQLGNGNGIETHSEKRIKKFCISHFFSFAIFFSAWFLFWIMNENSCN